MANGSASLAAPAWFGIAAGGNLSSQDIMRTEVVGTLVDRMDSHGQRYLHAPNVDPGSGSLGDSQVYFWLNESSNALTFVVKYSTGAVKRGTIPVS